ncbi:hypothetical protein V6N13_004555 [Hibiscus sabdariffa]
MKNPTLVEKFRPRIQVSCRKTHTNARGKATDGAGKVAREIADVESRRFAALTNIESEIVMGEELNAQSVMVDHVLKGKSVTPTASDIKLASKRQELVQGGSGEILEISGYPKPVLLRGSGSGSSGTNSTEGVVVSSSNVASLDVIVPSRVSLNPKDHVAVRVLERGSNQRVSGGKVVERKGGLNQKKPDAKPTSKVALGEWIGDLEKELARLEKQRPLASTICSAPTEAVDTGVQWRENTAFGQDLEK